MIRAEEGDGDVFPEEGGVAENARDVSLPGHLDLDDLIAELAQEVGRRGAKVDDGEVEDADAEEASGFSWMRVGSKSFAAHSK
jgi:hypothetical protein